jgi:hypothetical protein
LFLSVNQLSFPEVVLPFESVYCFQVGWRNFKIDNTLYLGLRRGWKKYRIDLTPDTFSVISMQGCLASVIITFDNKGPDLIEH